MDKRGNSANLDRKARICAFVFFALFTTKQSGPRLARGGGGGGAPPDRRAGRLRHALSYT